MNPNPGPDYGKFHGEKTMKELEKINEDVSVNTQTVVKSPPIIPPKDWPRFQVGERVTFKGHVWRVTEIHLKAGLITVKPVWPA